MTYFSLPLTMYYKYSKKKGNKVFKDSSKKERKKVYIDNETCISFLGGD